MKILFGAACTATYTPTGQASAYGRKAELLHCSETCLNVGLLQIVLQIPTHLLLARNEFPLESKQFRSNYKRAST